VGSIGVLDAAATVLGSRSPKFNQLILWARARADNTPISELCRTWRWPRSSFDQRLEEIAGRVADYLNKRQAETPSQAASSSPLESRDCPREKCLLMTVLLWCGRRAQKCPDQPAKDREATSGHAGGDRRQEAGDQVIIKRQLPLSCSALSPSGGRNASLDRSDLDSCQFSRRGEGMATQAQPRTRAKRILVVEDELMIRLLLEDMLSELGYTVAAEAARMDEALEATKNADFDLAILDANLNGQPVSPVADALVARGTPFVFATGYGELPEPYRDRPTLMKPFQMDGLKQMLQSTFG
jgi:CheY-like chemotaxis protein